MGRLSKSLSVELSPSWLYLCLRRSFRNSTKSFLSFNTLFRSLSGMTPYSGKLPLLIMFVKYSHSLLKSTPGENWEARELFLRFSWYD